MATAGQPRFLVHVRFDEAQAIAAVCVALLGACGKGGSQRAGESTVAGQLLREAEVAERVLPDSDTVQPGDSNRVYVKRDSSGEYLVWDAWTPVGRRQWRSANLFGARPETRLVDLNGDGTVDLFWTTAYEEMVGGSVVLNTAEGFVHLHPDVVACQEPELRQLNGRYFYVAHTPGVYSGQDCHEPIPGQLCAEKFQTTWPRWFLVVAAELREVAPTREYHVELARSYLAAATRLDSLLAAVNALPDSQQYVKCCGADAARRMRQLADSAQALAR
jgi:hypothetical protein